MNYTVENRIEAARGCGYRKQGGIYLVCDGPGVTCGMLPIRLNECPCCGAGIHPSRGYTWIRASLVQGPCKAKKCLSCGPRMLDPNTPMGLIWVGKQYYPTPEHFIKESHRMGISRRISQVPLNFKVGETWIALAQEKAFSGEFDEAGKPIPENRVFAFFQPQRIEYVVKDTDTPENLQRLYDRGFTLVRVTRDIDANTMQFPDPSDN